jgi:hypothetical protein
MGKMMLRIKVSKMIISVIMLFPALLYAQTQERSASSVSPDLKKSSEFSYLPAVKKGTSKKKENKFRLFSSNRSNKKYKGSYSWQLDQQVAEYKERMKAVAKQQKKNARLARKPIYSDPMYFGHKRKPKKRKPGKRKLCKECLVIH